jgi:hypothetical protein
MAANSSFFGRFRLTTTGRPFNQRIHFMLAFMELDSVHWLLGGLLVTGCVVTVASCLSVELEEVLKTWL